MAVLLVVFAAAACDPGEGGEPLTLADFCEPVDEDDQRAGYLCDPEDLEAYAAQTGDPQFRYAIPGNPGNPCVQIVNGVQMWGFGSDCEQDEGP